MESADGGLQPVYHASGETRSFGDYRPTITDEELCLHGFHLDVIETLCQPLDYTDSSSDGVKSWISQDKNEPYVATGETVEEAFLRTIVADFYSILSEGTGHEARGFAMVWPENVNSTDEAQLERVRFAQYKLMRAYHTRRFAYTRRGCMGLVPEGALIGDSIAVLLGGQMLYVLRSNAAGEARFWLVGEPCLHRIMDGEAMKMIDSGEYTIGTIVLE